MLGSEFIIAAITLRGLAGASYIFATWRGTVKPNPITWLMWGLAPLVAFAAQAQRSIEPSDWMSLALSLGPLCIFAVSLWRGNRWRLNTFDLLCGLSALIGLILWQVTTDPTLAIVFGIIADLLGGIPTVRKSYSMPQSERAFPYLLSIFSMVITLMTLRDWNFITFGFPLYILGINLVIFALVSSRIGWRLKRRRKEGHYPAYETS